MGIFNIPTSHSNARKQEMKGWAAMQNMQYQEEQDDRLVKQLGAFKLFQAGSRKTITSVCSASSLAHQCQLFDYSYTISTGKSSVQFHQTVIFIDSKQLALPQFYQKPETFFTRLWSALGMEDIDFSNFPEYSDTFHLKGPYEEVVRYYFSNEVLSLLSNQTPFYMEGMNYYFILYLHNKLCPTEQLTALHNLGMMLYELFKIRTRESEQLLLG